MSRLHGKLVIILDENHHPCTPANYPYDNDPTWRKNSICVEVRPGTVLEETAGQGHFHYYHRSPNSLHAGRWVILLLSSFQTLSQGWIISFAPIADDTIAWPITFHARSK